MCLSTPVDGDLFAMHNSTGLVWQQKQNSIGNILASIAFYFFFPEENEFTS